MEIIICYIFIYILESFILWQYCTALFYSKYSKSFECLLTLSFYIILFFASIQQIFWINTIAFFTANLILILILYRIRFSSALFHASIITIIMGLSELAVLGIISRFAADFYADRSYFRNLIILAVFSKFTYFLVLHIIVSLFDGTKEKNIQYDKGSVCLTITPFISLCVMLTLFAICLNTELSLFLDWMISISAILILIITLLIFWFYSYNQKKNQKFMELQLQLQKEYDMAQYYKMLLKQDENQKILIHDIKKHLQSIATLNENDEREKITAYIDRIIHSSDLQDSVHVCDNELLNSILCRYIQCCTEQMISFRTDIRSGSVDFLTEDDLTSLFSNLLENALEAAGNLPQSFIELNSVYRTNSSLTILTMINSCRKDPFSNETGSLISRKPDKLRHGFGMKSIQRIVRKYCGDMQVYYDNENKTFHTIITLKQV